MPTVAAWEASVIAYESAKNARSVARTVLAAGPGKQQVDQHRRAGLPHQRSGDARDGPSGEIEAGAHRKRRPMLAPVGLTRLAARDRHQYGKAKDHRPGGRPHQDRISITESDEAERQPNKTAER